MGAASAGAREAEVSGPPEWTQPASPADAESAGLQPLDRLRPGQAGRIVSIGPRQPGQRARLASFGVAPGAIVCLRQSRPATVLAVGETTLALDPAIAAGVIVLPIDEEGP
jgi:Fe2+ transport system protein FeoA